VAAGLAGWLAAGRGVLAGWVAAGLAGWTAAGLAGWVAAGLEAAGWAGGALGRIVEVGGCADWAGLAPGEGTSLICRPFLGRSLSSLFS